MTGIYMIENKINHRKYIGQAIDIELRKEQHIKSIKTSNKSWYPQARLESNSINDFSFTVLQECSINELDELEEYWTLYYNSHENGYNKKIVDGTILLKNDGPIKENQLELFKRINKKISGKCGNVRSLLIYLIILDFNNNKFLPPEKIILDYCNMSHSKYSEARKTLNELGLITYIQNVSITINYQQLLT